jgi:hypothetical protein
MIINKTPHDINIVNEKNEFIKTIPKSDSQIRLAVKTQQTEEIEGIKTSVSVFGEPEGLPEYKNGVFYIVSQLVKTALPKREDLLVPAEVVRDEKGQIIGCKSLGR